MSVRRMVNPVMPYAWGSHDGIATLQGRPASAQPEAELWMGAHPLAPSLVESLDGAPATALDAVISADPVGVLGKSSLDRFGPRLPYLLKVLAAAKPLSLQVHPDADQARAGFAAEEAAGLGASAPERSYRDPYSKPELLVALGDFHGLAGFRPAAEAAAALDALGVRRLAPLVDALRTGTPTGEVFLRLVEWPAGDRVALVEEFSAAVRSAGSPAWLLDLARDYPADPAVVGVLLLNELSLRAGQGVFIRPGEIHAYLSGTGVEIMGGSDNVVRAGLTAKHVSPSQLRAILAVEASRGHRVDAIPDPDGVSADEVWPAPVAEFELSRLRIGGVSRSLAGSEASVLLCVGGSVEMRDGDSAHVVALQAGESAFVTASPGDLVIEGLGVLMRATVGRRDPTASVEG